MESTAVDVGLRMKPDGTIEFFGVDAVNDLIASGRSIVRLEEGGAMFEKVGESDETVSLRMCGFGIKVIASDLS